MKSSGGWLALAGASLLALRGQAGPGTPATPDLSGLWKAEQRFGPDVRGPLSLESGPGGGRAEIAGRSAPVERRGPLVSFALGDDEGAFRGVETGPAIVGHWIQPRVVSAGARYATPVTLTRIGPGRWRGTVTPLDDAMTFYLPIRRDETGAWAAFLLNPERNAGRFMPVQHVVLEGSTVRLVGRRADTDPETTTGSGSYDAETDVLTVAFPGRGGSYDFRRVNPDTEVGFRPRPAAARSYAYRPPSAEDDGWPVATLEEAGIAREAIVRFVQKLIDQPIDSPHSSQVHALLLARHGKLVLEEYFHGFAREGLHDTRSAAKSITSALTGAAVLAKVPVSAETPVYATLRGPGAALDPLQRALKLEHLLTMSSGLDCDDNDESSPGNEDTMQDQQEQPDWYQYTLALKMIRAPGEKAVYCSCNPNLAGGVLAKASGRSLPDLFHDLLARPLRIERYAANLTPTGDAYMGGGLRLRLRDFMKLGQVMLDGGRWQGRPVVSAEWARRSVSPLYELGGRRYGYLWWVTDYPWHGRTVRAFFAGGNGGQIVMGIPELELVIGFYGGNYSDAAGFVPQKVFVPEDLLPAVN